MVATVLIIFSIFLFILVVIFVIWLIIKVFKTPIILENDPIILNWMAQYSKGRALGVEEKTIMGKGNRFIKYFSAKDINVKDENPDINTKIVAQHDRIIPFPKGTWSKDRDIIMILPPTTAEFPNHLKDHEFGKFLMTYVELKNAVESEVKILREGTRRRDAILKEMGDSEISEKYLKSVEGLFKDTIKSMTKAELDKPRYQDSQYTRT
ncbi:MAG: hypothetical protein AABY22_04565 [Nanoarchaeota archaeon]